MVDVVVVHVTNKELVPLGSHSLCHLPRIGDWVELKGNDGQAVCYDVVQVILADCGADICVTNPRPTSSARATLIGKYAG